MPIARFAPCVFALALAPARAELVLSAYGGGQVTRDSRITIEQPSRGTLVRFEDVRFKGDSFDSPIYYGVRAGYFFHRNFGAEAEFIHAKVIAQVHEPVAAAGTIDGRPAIGRYPMNRIVERLSFTHGLNFAMVNLVARRGFLDMPGEGRPPIIISVRAGVGPTVPHAESNVQGRAREQYEIGGIAFQAGGGVEVRIWRGLYGLFEYKYTQTNQRVGIADGTAETMIRSNHGVFGAAWHFR